MALAIKHIQFSDEMPQSSYFSCAPFPELNSPTHVTFAVTVDDRGYGWDFWGQAVLPSDARPPAELDGATGRIAVSGLNHSEITSAVTEYLSKFDDWIDLQFDGDLIFEDGE